MKRAPRGSVLVHVLILSVLMVFVAGLMMRMIMHRSTVSAQAASSVEAREKADGAVGRLFSAWAGVDTDGSQVCSNQEGFTCSPNTVPCVCTFTGDSALDTAVVYVYVNAGQRTACACAPKMGDPCPATLAAAQAAGTCP